MPGLGEIGIILPNDHRKHRTFPTRCASYCTLVRKQVVCSSTHLASFVVLSNQSAVLPPPLPHSPEFRANLIRERKNNGPERPNESNPRGRRRVYRSPARAGTQAISAGSCVRIEQCVVRPEEGWRQSTRTECGRRYLRWLFGGLNYTHVASRSCLTIERSETISPLHALGALTRHPSFQTKCGDGLLQGTEECDDENPFAPPEPL